MRLVITYGAAAALTLGLAAPASAAGTPVVEPATVFVAPMDRAQEVPEPGPSDARGTTSFTLAPGGGSLTFRTLTYGLDDVLAGHVHLGAPGEAGPVVATLASFAPLDDPAARGVDRDGLLAEGSLTEDDVVERPEEDFDGSLGALLARMRAGTAYVNWHTEDNRAGEIRGQVDPLPADVGVNGTFVDDDTNIHEGAIETLHSAGIARGVTPQQYGVGLPLRRGQAASFVARALNLPPTDEDYFDDDGTSVHEDALNRAAAAGIVVGCGPIASVSDDDPAAGEPGPVACPDEMLTRGQAASLLDRALALPPTDDDRFTDDTDSVHEGAINRVAAAGITVGCQTGHPLFCPASVLPRDQAASLVARALGLGPTEVLNVARDAGLVVVRQSAVDGVVEQVRGAVEADGGPSLVAAVDHAANAESVGASLPRPLTVLLVGNPAAGTPLMQAAQTAALDLPQKLLVAQVADAVEVDYNAPAYIAARHGITGQDDRLATLDEALLGLASAGSDDPAAPQRFPVTVDQGVGIETVVSDQEFDATVGRIRSAIEQNPATAIAVEVDHAAAAASAGLELRPTTLFVFGNPTAGTPLMQESVTAGIDLPQKMLVWQDAAGAVNVSYNDPEYVAARHGITGQDERLAAIREALSGLATS